MRCRECEGELSHEARARGTCRSCQDLLDDRARRQAAGQRAASGLPAAVLPKAKQPADILLTTESSSALPIIERFGIISAECVLGMNAFKDLGIGLRDIFGGRSAGWQEFLREARVVVLDDLRQQAANLGADAVVAVALNYSDISGGGKSMLFLVATGTAVRLAPPAAST